MVAVGHPVAYASHWIDACCPTRPTLSDCNTWCLAIPTCVAFYFRTDTT